MKNNTKAIIDSRKSPDSKVGPSAKLHLGIEGLFASHYSEMHSLRIKRGIAAKRAREKK